MRKKLTEAAEINFLLKTVTNNNLFLITYNQKHFSNIKYYIARLDAMASSFQANKELSKYE